MRVADQLDAEIKELERKMEEEKAGSSGSEADTVAGTQGKADEQIPANPNPEESGPSDGLPSQNGSSDPVDWEKRFKGYKAATDTTIHRLRVSLSDSGKRIRELESELEAVKAKIQEEEASKREAEILGKLKAKEVTDIIGEDVSKTITDSVKELVDLKTKDLNSGGVDSEPGNEEPVLSDPFDVFIASVKTTLAGAGIDFDTMNSDKAFLEHLHDIDPYTGLAIGDILQSAVNAHDAVAASRVFLEYAKGKANQRTIPKASGPEVVGTSGDSTKDNTPERKITMKDVDEFYAGGYKTMTQSEIKAFEDEVERLSLAGEL